MNQNCSACNMKIDINSYRKCRTVCKTCYNKNKNRRKNNKNTLIQNYQHTPSVQETCSSQDQPKTDSNNPCVSIYENHANVVIGPRNVGKTCYMLKILEKIGNKRHIHIRNPTPNQYPNYKTATEIKPIDKSKDHLLFLIIYWELVMVLK